MANRVVSVQLVADVGSYTSSMVRAAASTKTVGDSATTAGDKARRGFDMAGRGAALLGGVLAGGVAIGLKRTVDLASNAEQSIGGVEAVFKNYSRSVIADSKAADRALGLSANSYRELATVIGSQLKNAGVPMDELAEKTDGLISMGADLAAMFGGTTEEAVRALSSALKGEMDPIEAYGISLNDAALKAEAAAQGMEIMGGSLTNSQKVMAVMSLVTKQGADAIGAFGREQDTAAGRAQRAAAQWENLQTAIGEKLLPAWSALMDFVGTRVIPGMESVGSVIGGAIGLMSDNTEIALALGAALGVQLAGGITAVTVAFNRMIFTPVVLGLSSLLGVALNLPAAFAAASSAVAGFAAAAAPLVAVGTVVYAISKVVDFATAAGDARAEISTMWDAVDDARGGAQLEALGGVVDQLEAKIRSLNAELPKTEGAFQGFLSFTGMLENGGTINALNEYEDALVRAKEAQSAANSTATSLADTFGVTREEVLLLAEKYGVDLTQGATKAERALYLAKASEIAQGGSAILAAENTNQHVEQLENLASAADDAKKQTDLFKMSLDILTGAQVSLIQVEAAYYEALAEVTDATKGMTGAVLTATGGLNQQSEAGRAATNVLLGVKDSGNQLIATMIQQGATSEDVRAADARLRADFIKTAGQMGINRQAAEALADQILGIPAERNTRITADTVGASRNVTNLQAQIDGLRGKTVTVKVVTDRAALAVYAAQNGMQTVGGYAEGGYTGSGGKYEPAGVVHKGEVVWSQADVAAHGGPRRVDEMRKYRGYADGGIVVQGDSSDLRGGLQAMTQMMANSLVALHRPGAATANGVGGLGPAAARAHKFVRDNWGFQGTIGGYANRNIAGTNVKSKHAMGKAIDVMTYSNMALGQRIADYFAGPGRGAFGVDNVIWNRRIHSGRGWGAYRGASPHTDHPHIDFYKTGISSVPHDGPAYLHAGERVLSKEENAAWRSREFRGGDAGGSTGPTNVTVHARVFVGNREITDIARVEAIALLKEQDHGWARNVRSAYS